MSRIEKFLLKDIDCWSGLFATIIIIIIASIILYSTYKQPECVEWGTREVQHCNGYKLFGYHMDCHTTQIDYCVRYK